MEDIRMGIVLNWISLTISSVFFFGFWSWRPRIERGVSLFGLSVRKSRKNEQGTGGGTAGTVFAAIVAWFIFPQMTTLEWFFVCLVVGLLGLFTITNAENFMLIKWGEGLKFRSQTPVKHDRNETCIDEVIGFFVTLFPIKFMVSLLGAEWKYIVAFGFAFILFRVFDAFKLSFVRAFEKKIPGAFGIMGDDIIAGILAGVVEILIIYILGLF